MNPFGTVYLVGAGPGDAGLLTRKGERLLKEADVVVYDALVSPEILALIPSSCRTIPVGKRAGNHPVPQWQINQILLQEAQAGHRVVRLKGGDPFVFGRGGEELELLAEHGISFEVVPGITSAVAVPAYAGIPVTHRDYTSSFHVITGHARQDGEDRIDYEALVKLHATLVFLMGVSSMAEILRRLIAAGLSPDTPAAVLEQGTTNAQRRVLSDAAHLAQDAQDASIGTPAIFMVGKVCALTETFEWAELRPMGRKRVLICTSSGTGSRLEQLLTAEGAQVIALPAIRQEQLSNREALHASLWALANTPGVRYAVLTSPAGVRFFFKALREIHLDLRTLFELPNLRFAAIGAQTAKTLEEYGVFADLVPAVYSGKSLAEALIKEAEPDATLWLYRSERADTELLDLLRAAGRKVTETALYQTILLGDHPAKEAVLSLMESEKLTCAAFTSASAVDGFLQAMPARDWSALTAVCIGEKTAKRALDAGMRVLVSHAATLESMMQVIRTLPDLE